MLETPTKKRGRRKMNPNKKAITAGWTFKPSFLAEVQYAAELEDAESVSAWVRDQLKPAIQKVINEHTKLD